MINARINHILENDDELFNRVKAYGPGDGINRVSVTVEDATSISTYGLRETTQDFLDATSRSDLLAKAQEYLDEKKSPVTQVSITLFLEDEAQAAEVLYVLYDGEVVTFDGDSIFFKKYGGHKDVNRGDTIRVVSQELNLNTTGVVQELDWELGQVTLTLGKENYNLLEVINGPRENAERQRAALGLPTPIGFSAQRISPGIRVYINPYANSRAVGVEIYAGPTAGFTPDQSYLIARGSGTRFDFTNLVSGDVYYFKARSYDGQGNYSEVAGPVSAIAGFLPGSRVEGGTLDLSKFVSDTRPIKIVTSLPVVVSVDDPDYKVGMLVNYYDDVTSPFGALYRLISTTGDPGTDWVRAIDTESIADDAITADQILANTITANEINAGSISTAILITDAIKTNMIDAEQVTAAKIATDAITAEKIEAGAVTTGKIEAGAVTASKITVDGEVVVSNSTQASGAFSVKNASNTEVVRVGNITGKTGVPSGTQYGFWGQVGTGIYFAGETGKLNWGDASWARQSIVLALATGYVSSTGSFVGGGGYTSISVARTSQGVYTITHDFGTIPSCVVTPSVSNLLRFATAYCTTSTVLVRIFDNNGTAQDAPFSFVISQIDAPF
jgi:hypothetical protein